MFVCVCVCVCVGVGDVTNCQISSADLARQQDTQCIHMCDMTH